MPKSYKYQGSHPIENVLTYLTSRIATRSILKNLCVFKTFISMIKPKKVNEALFDADWIISAQEELINLKETKYDT